MIGKYMNIKEIAEFLGLTRTHVGGLCRRGEISCAIKDSNIWYAPQEAVQVWKLIHMKRDTRLREKQRQHRRKRYQAVRAGTPEDRRHYKSHKSDEEKTPLTKLRESFNPNYKLQDAAPLLGISHSTLGNYEKGKSDMPAQMIAKMAAVYGVSNETVLQAVLDTAEIVKAKKAINDGVTE